MAILKQYKGVISFDFDNTLQTHNKMPIYTIIDRLNNYSKNGYDIIIVTARSEDERLEIDNFIKIYRLPVVEIHFTNKEMKGPILKKIGVNIHIDDDPEQLDSARKHGIEAINMLRIITQDDSKYDILKSCFHKHL